MSRRNVLVKRLVCIEDLGDVDVLFTDKTGTLTEGHITFMRSVPVNGQTAAAVVRWGFGHATWRSRTAMPCPETRSTRRSGPRQPASHNGE
jgi:magnesium-transporting ATPase (P-type)